MEYVFKKKGFIMTFINKYGDLSDKVYKKKYKFRVS